MYNIQVNCLISRAIRDISGCLGGSAFEVLDARKVGDTLQVKDNVGGSMWVKLPATNTGCPFIVYGWQEVHGQRTCLLGTIGDERFSRRLSTYIQQYYGVEMTNCSSFVEYMRTGTFRACEEARYYVAISGGMNFYSGEKIHPGDTLGLLYFNKYARSRRLPESRKRYRFSKKRVGYDLSKLRARGGTISAQAFVEELKSGVYVDYHFMFCIDQYQGQPVFVQQIGHKEPAVSTDKSASIACTVGMLDMGYEHVPAWMLLKRGR